MFLVILMFKPLKYISNYLAKFERMQLTDYDRRDFANQFIELKIGLLNIFHEFIFSTISEKYPIFFGIFCFRYNSIRIISNIMYLLFLLQEYSILFSI